MGTRKVSGKACAGIEMGTRKDEVCSKPMLHVKRQCFNTCWTPMEDFFYFILNSFFSFMNEEDNPFFFKASLIDRLA